MQIQKFPFQKIPLWLIASFSLLGYFGIRIWFPLTPYFEQVPPMDIRNFTPTLASGLAYGFLILILFALFALAYQRVQFQPPPKVWGILIATLLFCLPLLQTYPFNATDIYRYIIRGRVNSVYDESSYAIPPSSFPDDPFSAFAGEWAYETSPYGPVWELIATAVTGLLGENLYALLFTFKIIGMVAHLGCTLLIWRILANAPPHKQAGYTLLWAWNPALLLTFVADAHNDVLMIFWLLFGLWIMRQHSLTIGFLIMMLAPLTKPIALLPLPLFFIAGWQSIPHLKDKFRFAIFAAIGGAFLIALAFLPFGSPIQLAARLLREASAAPGFSFTTLILLTFMALNQVPPVDPLALLTSSLFILFAVSLAWRTWNGRSPIRSSADIFVGYIAQTLSFRIWYATWLFPWLLIDDTSSDDQQLPYRLKVGLWFLLTSQLSVLIYGHIRVYLLGKDQFYAHLVGVLFTFLLPFLLAKLQWPFLSKQKDTTHLGTRIK